MHFEFNCSVWSKCRFITGQEIFVFFCEKYLLFFILLSMPTIHPEANNIIESLKIIIVEMIATHLAESFILSAFARAFSQSFENCGAIGFSFEKFIFPCLRNYTVDLSGGIPFLDPLEGGCKKKNPQMYMFFWEVVICRYTIWWCKIRFTVYEN